MEESMHEFRRYSQQYWRDHPEEHKSIVSDHIERIRRGKDYWNSWDKKFKGYCDEITNKNEFVPLISFREASLEGLDFSEFDFSVYTDFEKAVFVDPVTYKNTTFFGMVNFRNSKFMDDVSFYNTKFFNQADFQNSEFLKRAYFSNSKFSSFAMLYNCKFYNDCHFIDVCFDGRAEFGETVFFGRADFSQAQFFDKTEFIQSKFHEYSDFKKCEFKDNIDFLSTEFLGDLNFENSKFVAGAHFTGSTFFKSSKFSNTSFGGNIVLLAVTFKNSVPDFNLATFKQAPHLHGVKVVEPKKGLRDGSLCYRKLKSMANSSNDHENELKFFGYELHAKAFEICKPWYKLIFDVRFLLIKSYYLLSNFGQSVHRPVIALVVFISFMAFIVNPIVITTDWDYCKKTKAQNIHIHKYKQVLSYTLSSSLPLVTLDKVQKEAMDKCLFGDRENIKNPKTLMHSMWRLVHLIPTTLLFFLFGLALRNRFKI